MATIDAIILAGSTNDGKLRSCSSENYEALVEIACRPMVSYVVDTLRQSRFIGRIVIVGPMDELERLFAGMDRVLIAPGGTTPIESLMNALEVLKPLGRVLVATSDIPLLTGKSVTDFIRKCSRSGADVCYPVVPREVNDRFFPGVKRTYIKFKDLVVTGGNLFMINPRVVPDCAKKAQLFVECRKSPLKLAKLVGWRFLLKYLTGTLSLKDAEAKVSKIFGIHGMVVISPFPEVGIDVDKPSDLLLVSEKLAQKVQ